MDYKYDETYKRATSENSWIRRITMRKRLDNICREIKIEKSHRVLDIGCTGGILQHLMSNHCSGVYGLDINHHILKITCIKGKYICGDAMRMSLKSNYFDVVVCSHLLEHVPSIHHCLKEIDRISKLGAKIFIIYPIELFRGSSCIPDVLLNGQKLSAIRKIHLHKLSFNKLKNFIEGTNLRIVKHKIIFALLPMHMIVIAKQTEAKKLDYETAPNSLVGQACPFTVNPLRMNPEDCLTKKAKRRKE